MVERFAPAGEKLWLLIMFFEVFLVSFNLMDQEVQAGAHVMEVGHMRSYFCFFGQFLTGTCNQVFR